MRSGDRYLIRLRFFSLWLVMPEKIYDSFTREDLELASKYRPGYDWNSGYFGPPPGIPEAKKCELDRMNDKEYLYAFLRLSQEQKESLMISEAERRRTFNAHWPIQHVVRGNDLALEGFYYTGIADKVQCAFCCGIIRNWEKGDVPAQSHRAYFPYCKMVQKKPCFNIPFDETDSCKALVTEQLSMQTKIDSCNPKELGINTCKPANIKYALYLTRLETFKGYSSSNPIPPHDLALAGFYFIGSPDKVKCFSCDGELINWAVDDDSWVEHAKWFPGCAFVRENKGTSFIVEARSRMTKDDLEIALTLKYNYTDLSFLAQVKEEKIDLANLLKYKTVVKLGLDNELVERAYRLNLDKDFSDIQDLISLVNALDAKDETGIENVLKNIRNTKEGVSRDDQKEKHCTESPAKRLVDINELLRRNDDLTENESQILIAALSCNSCKENEVGAALLPCGHFCICESCSRGELPAKCPECGSIVRAAVRAFTS